MAGDPFFWRRKEQPPIMGLDGPRHRKAVAVAVGKPPKLRLQPGTFVLYEGQVHQIIYAYRVTEKPHEWFYCLENCPPLDGIAKLAIQLGLGSSTPRVVYELFRDHGDAQSFFWDIPCNGNSRSTLPNKEMMKLPIVDPTTGKPVHR